MRALIQPGVFGDEEQPLIDALVERGIEYVVSEDPIVLKGSKPWIVRGTLEYYNIALDTTQCGIIPGVSLGFGNYFWTRYTKYLNQETLLNKCWVCLPWWKLYDEDNVLNFFPDENRLFIRPNSGQKLFTGTTIGTAWWKKELDIIKSLPWSTVNDDDLVVVSYYREILAEFRFLMYRREIIDHSRYDDNGSDVPVNLDEIKWIISTISRFPDDFYSLDIAITEQGAKILELNSLACAGWYNCDPGRVIDKIMEVNGCNEFCIGSKE